MENTTEQASLFIDFYLEFNSTSLENKTFHIYLIKSDIIPHFDLLNNPAICCSVEGGSICDDYFVENDEKLKNNNMKVSYLLRDHSEFYKDYEFNEKNPNFILKKYIEKNEEKYIYNNPNNKPVDIKKNSSYENQKNDLINITNIKSDNNNYPESKRNIDYSAITSQNTLIINEAIFK